LLDEWAQEGDRDRSDSGHALPSMESILGAFTWPSEAFWRCFELAALNGQELQRPIFELGCGDGSFTELAGLYVDTAIDLSARSVARASKRTSIYGAVRQIDMRTLHEQIEQRYATIFANSVLEHVTGLDEVLRTCAAMLVPGGRLITTVPLVHMNDHLLLRRRRYAEWRRRRLCHHNLWDVAGWTAVLHRAGFEHVSGHGYLDARSCRFWDVLDLPASLGVGPVRLGLVTRRGLWPLLPRRLRRRIVHALAGRLEREVSRARPPDRQPCAALLVATTPGDLQNPGASPGP
jgi:SAM-dependent methyltransferase